MKNNDLISRDAAKNIVSLMVCAPTIKIVAEHEIDDLPAVDATPVRHGRWINQGFNPVRCSVCGVTPNALRGTTVQPDFKFCPYCGARMDGGDNNG